MSDAAGRLVCTFSVQGFLLGVPVAEVQEVLRQPEATRVPRAAACVLGVVNLRGQIIAAIDLRARLGLPPRGGDGAPMTVVVHGGEGLTALVVDEIGDVIEVSGDLTPPPETLPPHLQELALGIHELEGGLLVLLDAQRAASVEGERRRGDLGGRVHGTKRPAERDQGRGATWSA